MPPSNAARPTRRASATQHRRRVPARCRPSRRLSQHQHRQQQHDRARSRRSTSMLPSMKVRPTSTTAMITISMSIGALPPRQVEDGLRDHEPAEKVKRASPTLTRGVKSGRTARFSCRRLGSGTSGHSRSRSQSARIVSTAAARSSTAGAACGAMRAPRACQVDPALRRASAPTRVQRQVREARHARRDGRLQEFQATATARHRRGRAPTSAATRPKRGSTMSARQKPNGAYSSTLFSMSLREARAQVSAPSASISDGPSGQSGTGRATRRRSGRTTTASSSGAAKCERLAIGAARSGRARSGRSAGPRTAASGS